MKMIVHDLKTPLTSVLATLEMLADGDFGQVTTPQKAAIGDAETKSEDLLALIDDILEVARIEEANISLTLAPIAPGALLAELVHEWGHRFQQEGTTASVSVADDAPVFSGDKGLIKRVFSNLIQNAVTHSSHAVHLELNARRARQGVLFTVSDNGPGIPSEYHDLIFRKFGQVEMPRSPRTRSSGLGLTFCKLVVERHGGRIWVKSAEGKGSSFYIELPSDPTAVENQSVTASTASMWSGTGR
jgi:two-component system sensor histidine kinase/response regulator